MKLAELLIVMCCSIIAVRSETSDTDQELLKRASEQLERLAPYRQSPEQEALDLANLLEAWRPLEDQDVLNKRKIDGDQGVPWELLEILPDQAKSDEATKRTDEKKRITIDIIADPKYAAMMQERIKRGFDAGSASLLTSIAGGVLSGVASASSGSAAKASASSSQHVYKPAYDSSPAYDSYSYEEKPFGAWDFKKAIFSTVYQALKAIGGGVLALKGQLVKGGGYLLAAKGKVISKTGDVITSYGKKLTSSVATYPASYPPDTYTYEQHPPTEDIGHNFQGPPPSSDGYSEANDYSAHSTYGVPSSDDHNQGGLLIVTPTKSDLDEHSDQYTNIAEAKPDFTKLEESFGGPIKTIKDFLISVPKGSGGVGDTTDHQAVVAQDDHDNNINVNSYANPPIAHPAPTYGAPEHYTSHHNPTQTYENPAFDQGNLYHHHHHHLPEPAAPLIPPSHHFPSLADPHLAIQQSVEYPPLHVQQLDYPHGPLTNPLLEPVPKLPLHDDGGTSVYASITVDTEPQVAPLKVPLLGYPGALDDLPKLQPHVDFHGQPHFANLHNSLDNPLRIHLLNPLPAHWQGQDSFAPASAFGTLNPFRKRNALQKRMLAGRRLARYASTRLHRL